MRNKFLLIAALLLLAGGLAVLLLHEYLDPANDKGPAFTEKDLAEAARKHFGQELPALAAPAPINPSRSIRLAIGSLGLAGEESNRRAGDLVLAQLTGAKGLELVERQELDVVLREMSLNVSGLVRAKDAIRVGKLLRADWFLLGSGANLNGTNYTVVRIVDAQTGVVREAGVFEGNQLTSPLASALAGFVRQCRQNAAEAKSPVYLSVGAFEDLSVNNRQAALPSQLRSYLTAANNRSGITLLEREFADVLLREMRLDLAGLTDESGTNIAVMQSAYWMVDGHYQSYEESGFEVELVLAVRRMFGRSLQFTLRGHPGEPLFRQVQETLGRVIQDEQSGVRISSVTELRAQFTSGKEIFRAGSEFFTGTELISPRAENSSSYSEMMRRRRNYAEAIRAFETVLLLDPNHREAKLYLAACFRQGAINRHEEARDIYRELIEAKINDPVSDMACRALANSFREAPPEERLRWFEAANRAHTHAFYRSQIEAANEEISLTRTGTNDAERIAEGRLFADILKWENNARRGSWELNFNKIGFGDYAKVFGTNQARLAEKLSALLPGMHAASSNLAPYLTAAVTLYQVDTNAPVIAQFERSLAGAAAQPEKVFGAKKYFSMVSREVHNWAVDRGLYRLAVLTKEVRERMAQQKFAEPLDDADRMGLAFSYLQAEAWQNALAIFQSYSNRPVQRGFSGVTKGAFMPVFTGKQADFCREKLGLPTVSDPREFEMGTNCLCLHTRSTFLADSGGLWIGAGDELLRLDFDLKTNFVVRLPTGGYAPITVLHPGASNLWIGTDGAGLIEYDKSTRQSRRFTVKEGLLMDSIASLLLARDALWIGYGNGRLGYANDQGGGLGRLDLATHAAKSFTPSLAEGTEVHRHPSGKMVLEPADKPTRRSIHALASGPDGEILFATEFHALRKYHPAKNVWAASPIGSGNSIVTDAKRLYGGGAGTAAVLGVTVWDFQSNKVWGFEAAEGLPYQNVSTLCLDGEHLWVGGFGFVAVVGITTGQVRKFAYVPAESVDQIQIGGGYVWAKYEGHLHRALLSGLR